MRFSIDGSRVKRDWYWVLRGAEFSGVAFQLREGWRTLAEQARFYWGWIRRLPGFNLAARPTPFAPHIRVGRQDHALDVYTTDGGKDRLDRWLAAQGVDVHYPVRGEDWHMEARSAAALHAAAEKWRKRLNTPEGRLAADPLKPGDRSRDVRPVQIYLRRGKYLPRKFKVARKVGTYGPRAVAAVKAFQRKVGLEADGIVGARTFLALKRRYGR